MNPSKRHTGVKKKRKVGPGKRLVNHIAKSVAAHQADRANRKAAADQELKTAVSKALDAALAGDTTALQGNPKLARAVAEEAAVQAAADYGINIRKANGKIDTGLARQAAERAAIQAAAEMGFDITDSRGQISRRKAFAAAQAADDARAGKPVDALVAAFVSRQDARLAAAFKAAERRGLSIEEIGGEVSRRDAYNDAELAALIRRHIGEKIG